MSSPNESIEDILAKALAETCGSDGVIYTMDGRTVMEYVDRIKAARKREREEAKQEFVAAVTKAAAQAVTLTDEKWKRDLGNAAKLREAVERIASHEVDDWCLCPDCSARRELRDVARAALASPARNCDRPGCTSYAAAVAMHLAACGPSAKGGERELVEWLLAPAKQVKGGAE